MIENEQQYHITQAQAQKFEKALERMLQSSEQERETNPLLWQAQISALESQLSDLREEIEEYNTSRVKSEGLETRYGELITVLVEDVIRVKQENRPLSKIIASIAVARVVVTILHVLWSMPIEGTISLSSALKEKKQSEG